MTQSRYVPTVQRRQNAPRGGVKADYTMRLDPGLRVTAERTAKALNISLPYLFHLAAGRFMDLVHDELENGLVPVPARLATEELDLIDLAAADAGLTAERWAVHVLMDAAGKAQAERAAENINDKRAAA